MTAHMLLETSQIPGHGKRLALFAGNPVATIAKIAMTNKGCWGPTTAELLDDILGANDISKNKTLRPVSSLYLLSAKDFPNN